MAVRIDVDLASDPTRASFPLSVPRRFEFKVTLSDDEAEPGTPIKRTITFKLHGGNPFSFDPAAPGGPLRKAIDEQVDVPFEGKEFSFVQNIRRTGNHNLVSIEVTLEVPGPRNTFCSIIILP